jgi:arsenic resistance protein ArsH
LTDRYSERKEKAAKEMIEVANQALELKSVQE